MWDRSSIFEFLFFIFQDRRMSFGVLFISGVDVGRVSEAVFTFGCRVLQLGETGTFTFQLFNFSCSYVGFDIHCCGRLGWIEVATRPRIDVGLG